MVQQPPAEPGVPGPSRQPGPGAGRSSRRSARPQGRMPRNAGKRSAGTRPSSGRHLSPDVRHHPAWRPGGGVYSLLMNLSFRRLGLQRRIMLYVTLGLAAMFGFLVFLGLGAIDQASRLVFEERLSTAYTTAGIIERDFGRIATDVREASRMQGMASGSDAPGPEAGALL